MRNNCMANKSQSQNLLNRPHFLASLKNAGRLDYFYLMFMLFTRYSLVGRQIDLTIFYLSKT